MKKGFVIPLVIAIIAILVIGGGIFVYQNKKVEAPVVPQIIGGDKDEHGCLGPAGYSWCAVKNKCLRVWEEKCEAVSTSTQPSITVISPNGGEVWEIGQTYIISFSMTDDLGIKTVRLNRYSDDGVRVGSELIGTTDKNTISFKIPIGTETTRAEASRYKVQVIVNKYAEGRGVADESDEYFVIIPSVVEPIACTMDAKMCPDGTYVGRTGPKCEFAPCPRSCKTDQDCMELFCVDGGFAHESCVQGKCTISAEAKSRCSGQTP